MEESESYLIPHLSFLQEKGFATGTIHSGVVVQEVMPNSLAEQIGLKAGDVIRQLNGQSADITTFSALVASSTGGKTNRLTLLEDDTIQNLDFRCAEECKLGISLAPNSTLEIKPIKF
jgi:S1-C subfamily serine protease